LTVEQLKEFFIYNPETGLFSRKKIRRGVSIDKKVGCARPDGYVIVQFNGKFYYAHALAWLYMTGAWAPFDIDHINENKSDNRWCNLRQATRSQNQAHRGPNRRNTSGYKGVSWDKCSKKWKSQIRVNYKLIYLGVFSSKEDAFEAYQIAAREYFGDFASWTSTQT
jgi:hypothetical protein